MRGGPPTEIKDGFTVYRERESRSHRDHRPGERSGRGSVASPPNVCARALDEFVPLLGIVNSQVEPHPLARFAAPQSGFAVITASTLINPEMRMSRGSLPR